MLSKQPQIGHFSGPKTKKALFRSKGLRGSRFASPKAKKLFLVTRVKKYKAFFKVRDRNGSRPNCPRVAALAPKPEKYIKLCPRSRDRSSKSFKSHGSSTVGSYSAATALKHDIDKLSKNSRKQPEQILFKGFWVFLFCTI